MLNSYSKVCLLLYNALCQQITQENLTDKCFLKIVCFSNLKPPSKQKPCLNDKVCAGLLYLESYAISQFSVNS